MTDARGNTIEYTYDGQGNLASTRYPDGTVESAAYDPIGNVMSTTDRNGQAIAYTYDASGNVLTETFADGSEAIYTYDSHENLTSATDSSGTITLAYDANDRLTKITYPTGRYLSYSYDAVGRRSQMVDQDGFTVNYAYDSLGRLASLTDGSGNLIVRYTYNIAGLLSRADQGNGTFTTYDYDVAGELIHLINFAPDGTVDSRFDYTYDALGNPVTEATLDGGWSYTYDAIGELIHAVFTSTDPAISNQDLIYAYDAAGNRTETIINGVTTVYVANSVNEYTSVGSTTFGYDANGNMVSATDASGTTTFSYNLQNRLIGASGPDGTSAYQYDPLGNLEASTQSGQTTDYLVDPIGLGNVVASYSGSGSLIDQYIYGLALTSLVNAQGTAVYYSFSANGNTSDLTDAAGSVVSSYFYDPFGRSLAKSETIPNPFQFAGEVGVMNSVAGFDLMRFRAYSAALGRFTSPDPIGLQGGSLDLYSYVHNDPMAFVDPSGLKLRYLDLLKPEPLPLYLLHKLLDVLIFDPPDIPGEGEYPPPRMVPPWWLLPPDTVLLPPNLPSGLPWFAPLPPDWQGPPLPLPFAGSLLQPPVGYLFLGADADAGSHDPNALLGPSGYGAQSFVAADQVLPYQIDFENDPTATAPAQRVDVTDQLDRNLDWNTFQLTGVGFGDNNIAIPANSQHFETTVPMTYNGRTFHGSNRARPGRGDRNVPRQFPID